MDEIVKVCKKHGELKLHEVYLYKRINKTQKACVKCRSIACKNFVKKNREKVDQSKKNYVKKNIKKVLEKNRISNKKHTEKLSDFYVKQKIKYRSNIKLKDIPQELVELKRIQLQIYRHLKELKNGNKQHEVAT